MLLLLNTSFVKHARTRFNALLFLSLFSVLALSSEARTQQAPSELPRGWGTPTGIVAEPAILGKLISATDGSLTLDREGIDGPSVEFGNMITDAGKVAPRASTSDTARKDGACSSKSATRGTGRRRPLVVHR